MPTPEREKSRKMRRGGRRSGAPPRSLISLLWASSTLSTSEVKGHTKYISECHLRGEGGGEERRGGEEMIVLLGLLTNLDGAEQSRRC